MKLSSGIVLQWLVILILCIIAIKAELNKRWVPVYLIFFMMHYRLLNCFLLKTMTEIDFYYFTQIGINSFTDKSQSYQMTNHKNICIE